jgi:TRAP-type C4-dicarboxylate transport system permease small subunit
MKHMVERLEQIQIRITFFLISALTITVSLQIFIRLVLQKPWLLWTEEWSRYLLIWTLFLGIGVGVKNDRHFAMDVLPPLLGRRWGGIVRVFNDLCMGAILVMLILAGLRFSRFGLFQYGLIVAIPMVCVFIAIPIGGILGLLYLIERIQQRVRGMREGESQ